MVRVIDLFAGPGGLGEGFSAWCDGAGRHRFELALSIERDDNAHATLRLRSFRRRFGETPPDEYAAHVRGAIPWDVLSSAHRPEATAADAESRLLDLGPKTAGKVRELVTQRLGGDEKWVLIGGPPCQAYSLAGRSRNRGKEHYRPSRDRRQKLYVEYLQILADHAPPVFVMENVKGLLSARLNNEQLFDRISDDLRDPAGALRRESRSAGDRRPKYVLNALNPSRSGGSDCTDAFIVRSEEFGVPQRRHRVIVIGVREDVEFSQRAAPRGTIVAPHVEAALAGLPRLRSGLSRGSDSPAAWVAQVASAAGSNWLRSVDSAVARRIRRVVDHLSVPRAQRGCEYSNSPDAGTILNHSTRGHMASDLHRYLFASAFAAEHGSSPDLREFPRELLPLHDNVKKALAGQMFGDRFRVQVANQPATTITSHISKDGHYYIHFDPSQCRSLTVREAARLQTFPDDYFFCGPRTSQYHQVGNAVPPLLARHIAGVVAEILR